MTEPVGRDGELDRDEGVAALRIIEADIWLLSPADDDALVGLAADDPRQEIMAQMDLASGIRAAERARGRVVTAAVKEMAFELPVKIGDTLSVYTDVERVGRTSITLIVEAWAHRSRYAKMEKVTAGTFIMTKF